MSKDWRKDSKKSPPVQFRVTAAQFAELKVGGRKRQPKVSAHAEAKLRMLSNGLLAHSVEGS